MSFEKANREVHPFNKSTKNPQKILYTDGHFVVGFGEDIDGVMCVGVRWSEVSAEYKNFPRNGDTPLWFLFPKHGDISVDFLRTLVGKDGANNEAISEAIKILQNQRSK